MRWISVVEVCFYTCAYLEKLKFRYAQNLLCHGAKDWWNFVTKDYSPAEKCVVSREQFVEKFREEYVPLVERE